MSGAWSRARLDAVVRDAGRVGVLMGGASGEREVSLKSGAAVTAALRATGVDATALDWAGTLDNLLGFRDYDRFFVALHGRGGEDGQVQAALDLMGKPYTGTGVTGCALAMDKYRAKLAWIGAGLPTPDYRVVDEHSDVHDLVRAAWVPLERLDAPRAWGACGTLLCAGDVLDGFASLPEQERREVLTRAIEMIDHTLGQVSAR